MRFTQKFVFIAIVALFTSVAAAQDPAEDGISLFRNGNYEEAVKVLQTHLQSNAKDRGAWMYLGASHLRLGNDREAVKAFRKVKGGTKTANDGYDKNIKVISKQRPSYTESARRRGESGEVRLAVKFRSDGTIGFIFPFWSNVSVDLIRSSIDSASGIKFEPAEKNGVPVTVVSTVGYSFSIF